MKLRCSLCAVFAIEGSVFKLWMGNKLIPNLVTCNKHHDCDIERIYLSMKRAFDTRFWYFKHIESQRI